MTVYVDRNGGFGNQLFQLAAAIGLDEHGDGRLLLRPGEQPLLWHIGRSLMTPEITADDHRAAANVPPEQRYRQPERLVSDAFQPPPNFSPRPRRIAGYFQHPDWYTAALPRIVDAILADAPPSVVAAPNRRAVVHVRGADYGPLGWMLPHSYYVAARGVAPFERAITITGDDDRGSIVAGVLTAAGTDVAAPTLSNPVNDFWTLVAAPTLVMSNSTFAWWAAHAGDELYRRAGLRRTVVFPKQWILGEGAVLCAPGWVAV